MWKYINFAILLFPLAFDSLKWKFMSLLSHKAEQQQQKRAGIEIIHKKWEIEPEEKKKSATRSSKVKVVIRAECEHSKT